MTVGQLIGRLMQEALARHNPSRPAGADGEADRTLTAKQQAAPERGSAPTAKGAARHTAATDSLPKAEANGGRQAASSTQTRVTPTAKPRAAGHAIPAATDGGLAARRRPLPVP